MRMFTYLFKYSKFRISQIHAIDIKYFMSGIITHSYIRKGVGREVLNAHIMSIITWSHPRNVVNPLVCPSNSRFFN